MNETTQNFMQVMQEFEWPDPKPITFRLYYDQQGMPVCYSMEDLPGEWIEIDAETYAHGRPNVRVVDKKIQILQQADMVSKLCPANQGTCCDPSDVCIVVESTQPHTKWNKKYYEQN